MVVSGCGEESCDTCSLYVHVPFCSSKCPYCHFYSIASAADSALDAFMEALHREWEQKAPQLSEHKLVSIYFGGGTPTLLGPERIRTLLGWIGTAAEVTIEANPENLSENTAEGYLEAGVNRLSVGVQALDDNMLKVLGRLTTSQRIIEAIESAATAGFDNISADLMFDLPGQSLQVWQETLQSLIALPLTHVSLYNLTIEPGTAFHRRGDAILNSMPGDDASTMMLHLADGMLRNGGFRRYEISAWCRNNLISTHNVGYWTGRPFLGLGPSAFSYWDGRRFKNISNLKEYCNGATVDFEEKLSDDAHRREMLAVQLRLINGVDLDSFQRRYGGLATKTVSTIKRLIDDGLLTASGAVIALSLRGRDFYDAVASEVV